MTDEFELMVTRTLEDGLANEQILDLTRAHCTRAEFVSMGGRGVVAEAYGVPVGHHWMQCHRAMSDRATWRLQDVAVAFYRQHCVGCPDRNLVAVPNLSTYVAELDRAEEAEADRQARQRADLQSAWDNREATRRSLQRSLTDNAIRSIIDNLSEIDPRPSEPEGSAEANDGAISRLLDTAALAPELFVPDVVDLVFDLAGLGLEPAFGILQRLLVHGSINAQPVVLLALDHLESGHGHQAAASCLVAAGDGFTAAHVSAAVTISAVNLAGHFVSWPSETAAVQHPALLVACFDRDPQVVANVFTQMLGGAVRQRTLLLPGGETHLVDSANDDVERATAANAASHLLDNDRAAQDLVPILIRALDIPDTDTYESRPSSRICHTLAKALLAEPEAVASQIKRRGPGLTAAGRERLFDAYRQAAWLAQPEDPGWADLDEDVQVDAPSPKRPVSDLAAALIVRRILEHLRGDWGPEVATDAAEALDGVLDAWPGALDDSIQTLLGVALQVAGAPLERPSIEGGYMAALDQISSNASRSALVYRVFEALGHIAERKRVNVLAPVMDLLNAPRLDSDGDLEIRTRLIKLVGTIGSRPGALAAAVPTIYTSVLSDSPAIRAAGIEAWASVEGRESRLPSTFNEVLEAALRTETFVAPLKALLRHLPALCQNESVRITAVNRLIGIVNALDPDDEFGLLEPTLESLVVLGRSFDDEFRRTVELFCLTHISDLPPYKRRSFLARRRWSESTKSTPTYAAIVLRLLADPHVIADLNDQLGREAERIELRRRASTIVELEYEEIANAARAALEHRLPAASFYVELLAASGRWIEAERLAVELHDAVPDIPRMEWARALTASARDAACLASCLARGSHADGCALRVVAAGPETLEDQDSTAAVTLIWANTIRTLAAASGQLATATDDQLGEWVRALDGSARDVRDRLPYGPEWSTWLDLVDLAAALLRWDRAVRGPDGSTTELDTARRLADTAAARARANLVTPAGALLIPLAEAVAADLELVAIAGWLNRLASTPLPVPALGTRTGQASRSRAPSSPPRPRAEPTKATAVCLPSIDNMPATWVQVLRRDRLYDLTVELRLTDWPDWAERLEVELVSVVPSDLLQLPAFSFSRPDADRGADLSVCGTGQLLLRFEQGAGAPAREARVLAWFQGDGRAEQVEVAGYNELHVRVHDETRDGMTERRVVDERLLHLFAAIPADTPDRELQAFARFVTAIVRQGLELQFDQGYKRGARIRERDFHSDLEERLLADPALGGRLTRGDRVALGFLDLRHDGINAELKVERRTTVTVQTSHKYLGQPTQYGIGESSRLSILVVLDMTKPSAPIGVLSNYLGLMVPSLHGLSDPGYPSFVAVVILNGNNPVPSSWSRNKIEAVDVPLPSDQTTGREPDDPSAGRSDG